MLLALVACWRPEPYVPPAPPLAAEATLDAAAEATLEVAPEAADAATATPAVEMEAADPTTAAADVPEPSPDEQGPAFTTYRARNVQAPVTLVDDFGKNLVVIPTTVELEVRDEDAIRARVWCGTCTPAIEGWIQSHLLQRVD